MIVTLWAIPSVFYSRSISENYRIYAAKMAELRAYRAINGPLLNQLKELFMFVRLCEARWYSLGLA